MGPGERARILLADDHPAALAQATTVLGEHWDIAGTASNGLELLAAAARLHPDAIVVDIAMPLMDGFEAVRRLRDTGNDSAIVFLTVWDDPEYVAEALALGADAYVVKARLVSELVPAVIAALKRRAPGRTDPRRAGN
jgi:DNA-binding NarL/FixJ family response regulator